MNLKKKSFFFWGLIGFFSVISALIIYGVWIEPYRVEVHHLWIRDSRLGEVLGGKIVVQLSDLHICRIGRREQRVLNILNDLKPDIIFLTGDYVKRTGDYKEALTFLSKLKARIGIWAVMGDYDYSCSRKSCLFCHEEGDSNPTRRHSVRFLKNSLDMVNLPNGPIWIGGIDMNAEFSSCPKKIFQYWKRQEPVIILSHNPLMFNLFDEDQDMLMLAGDTHGGQILLPSWLWRVIGYEKSAKYNQGLFERGRKKMFVSSGIGTSHLPIRILRYPEVVVLHFRS